MKRILFSTTNYKYLEQLFLEYQNKHKPEVPMGGTDGRLIREGSIEFKNFPDGETYHRFTDPVAGKQVIIIGGTTTDTETLELYDLACHAAKSGAASLTLVLPYFGYSTMERAVQPGEIVKAKTRARLLSSIPAARMKVLFMDLHSEGTPHYLEGAIQPVHLYAKKVIIKMCRKISVDEGKDYKENHDFVLASTDAGRAKWVESLANEMGVECAIITKRRKSGTDTEIVGINADVKGKKVVIYDDMIRTGGSLIGAGQAYLDAGASKVYAVATHGVLPGESLLKLMNSQVFEKVYVTNTHPKANELKAWATKNGVNGLFYDAFDVSSILYRYLSKH